MYVLIRKTITGIAKFSTFHLGVLKKKTGNSQGNNHLFMQSKKKNNQYFEINSPFNLLAYIFPKSPIPDEEADPVFLGFEINQWYHIKSYQVSYQLPWRHAHPTDKR